MENMNANFAGRQTPFYVYDFDRVRSDIREMREILGDAIGLCFAMKANPFLVKEIVDAVDRIEVCSMGEYRICRKLGIAPEKLYISGVLKEPEDIREILTETKGASRYTAESPAQYRLISEWAAETKTPVLIYPRLTSGNQFGMDEENVLQILRQAAEHPYVTVEGIHFFSGTQKRNAGQIRKELQKLDVFFRENPELAGISELEFGPGLTVNYFIPDSWEKSKEMLAETVDEVRKMAFSGHVTLEMGRGIAANCGYYVTQVRDIKVSNGNNICIVDGGIHHLNYDGQMMGMKHPRITVLKGNLAESEDGRAMERDGVPPTARENREKYLNKEIGDVKEWDVYGSLCTTHDILVKRYPLGELAVGDVLVFAQTGAYSSMEGIVLLLSHEMPMIFGCDEAHGVRVLRERVDTWTLNA